MLSNSKKALKGLLKYLLIISIAYALIYLMYIVVASAFEINPLLKIPAFAIAVLSFLIFIKVKTGFEFNSPIAAAIIISDR